jgi:hypothetical protein
MSAVENDPLLVLKKIVQALERLPSDDRKKLFLGEVDIEVRTMSKGKRSAPRSVSDAEIQDLTRLLLGAETREAAAQLLADMGLTRTQLEAISRRLELPLLKGDKTDMLVSRIVEATTGSKLRSAAIRGPNK